jgi:hypothetical protein
LFGLSVQITGFVDGDRGLMTLSDLKRRSKAKPVESNLGPGVEMKFAGSAHSGGNPAKSSLAAYRLLFVVCRAARQRRFSVNCGVMNDTTLIQG